MNRVRVVILNTALGPLDYSMPPGMVAPPGSIVKVPLGPRQVTGVVWDEGRLEADEVDYSRLRPILEAYDAPPLPDSLRRLIEWTANYYLAPLAAVLRMSLSSSSGYLGEKTVTEYRASGGMPERMTPKREQALELIGDEQGLIRELSEIGEVSDAVIRGLVKTGALEPVEVSLDAPFPLPDPEFAPPLLEEGQKLASARLVEAVRLRKFAPIMLDGVTGSGKTEVYFEAVAEALRMGRQTLVLLPEIALTEPFLTRFTARFGCEPVAWHSGLRQSERRRAWRAIAKGEAQVTVGARSSLFLPYPDLGLIIVDEAHESAFKQEDGVMYHARDVAVMRGNFANFPVVLASATPALETRQMVDIGRYDIVTLPGRYGAAEMPDIAAIDMLQDPPPRGHWLAPTLVKAVEETLERKEQALLFLNRRGYAPLTLCRTCGHRFQCPNCTAWMVEHRLLARLACHHCGHVMPPPAECPECGAEDSLVACGPGVERIADEAAKLFPDAKTAIVTSDTIWSPAKAAEFVHRMEAGDIDIVIGTQLVTKGYHFPNLTLVGVVDADLGLQGGDLRAGERTFQQIMQVSGRAGRGETPGRVFIQTHDPSAPVIEALVSGDAESFYAAEAEARRLAGAPPFGRYAGIIISSENEKEAFETARMIGQRAPKVDGMQVLGPAPAPLAMLRGRHRQRLLVHARRALDVQEVIRNWLGEMEFPRGVRVAVDVDPYSFL
ncbi:primosomal protein N' [Parasphingopyxis marina]|uniref:Replication restart protein PriA n=1 Tax=Parasphingopyxis marina TaxID=2761622 RepID=A0A842HTV2_9SPHN|nr:primosomal protein N' [Parasphingopyxis marina]MBC2777368.1 primosomal protein N' [Parasphingopyxis marina]